MPIAKIPLLATPVAGSAIPPAPTAPDETANLNAEDKLYSANNSVSTEAKGIHQVASALAEPKAQKVSSSALSASIPAMENFRTGLALHPNVEMKHARIMQEHDIVSLVPIAQIVEEAARSGNPTLLVETVSSQQAASQRNATVHRHAYTNDAYFQFQTTLRDPFSHVKIKSVEFSVAFSANPEDWFILSTLTLTSKRSQKPPYVYEILNEVILNESASGKAEYLVYAALCFASGISVQIQDMYSTKLPKAASCCLRRAQQIIGSAEPGLSAESVRERLNSTVKAVAAGLSVTEADFFRKADLSALILG